jgi:protein SCO1
VSTLKRLAFLLALAGCAHPQAALHGTQLVPPQPAQSFSLTDEHGRRFSLQDARGQAVALYFGFTHCADVCPQTLALLGKARQKAGLASAQLRIVMVSVDPRRDTPQALRRFFAKVGVPATGLTGTRAELARVYKAYGIAVQHAKRDIVHTDVIFLIDRSGRIVETLSPEMPLKDVAADLRSVVE